MMLLIMDLLPMIHASQKNKSCFFVKLGLDRDQICKTSANNEKVTKNCTEIIQFVR